MTDRDSAASLVLPSVLYPVTGWREIEVQGKTIGDALEQAFERTPILRHHLMQENGELRPHVLCVLNDVTIARGSVRTTPIRRGDEILIHQAISGG